MKIDVIHRQDPGGPEASIDCAEGGSVLATWHVDGGQLLQTHPELNTGGYTYFTLDTQPTNVIKQENGGHFSDFSGLVLEDGTVVKLALDQTEPGIVYRAHILLAYEDGPAWHNDTRFTCEVAAPPPPPPVDTLPETGISMDGLLMAGAFLIAAGVMLLRRFDL